MFTTSMLIILCILLLLGSATVSYDDCNEATELYLIESEFYVER